MTMARAIECRAIFDEAQTAWDMAYANEHRAHYVVGSMNYDAQTVADRVANQVFRDRKLVPMAVLREMQHALEGRTE